MSHHSKYSPHKLALKCGELSPLHFTHGTGDIFIIERVVLGIRHLGV